MEWVSVAERLPAEDGKYLVKFTRSFGHGIRNDILHEVLRYWSINRKFNTHFTDDIVTHFVDEKLT